jgi:hypothetical protein
MNLNFLIRSVVRRWRLIGCFPTLYNPSLFLSITPLCLLQASWLLRLAQLPEAEARAAFACIPEACVMDMARSAPPYSAMQKLPTVTLRVWHGATEMALERGTNPKPNVVRLHVSTGYNRVEGNRRASRNGRVSDLPPELPNVTIRDFFHRCTPWKSSRA